MAVMADDVGQAPDDIQLQHANVSAISCSHPVGNKYGLQTSCTFNVGMSYSNIPVWIAEYLRRNIANEIAILVLENM